VRPGHGPYRVRAVGDASRPSIGPAVPQGAGRGVRSDLDGVETGAAGLAAGRHRDHAGPPRRQALAPGRRERPASGVC
jgi:hypothetical protein